MKTSFPSTLLLILLTPIALSAGAADIGGQQRNAATETETIQIDNLAKDKASAERWGLTLEQWQRYQTYMENGGNYFYSHLDPVFVSGIIAKTDIERRQIAELYARQELERTRRLIAFQDEFTKAMKRMGADHNVLSVAKMREMFGDMESVSAANEQPRSGDRIVLFVSSSCGSRCKSEFRYHYKKLGKQYPAGVALDVYFVGKHTDTQIQSWARGLKINPGLVKSGRVTLNHDDRYRSFGEPPLPAAFLVRGREVVGKL